MEKPIFQNDVVQSQLKSEAVGSMIQTSISRVLLIYTGGTIGMMNNPSHGYVPVAGFLGNTLAKSERFNDPLVSRGEFNTALVSDSNGRSEVVNLEAMVTPKSLYGKRIRYSVLEYSPLLDSCNITMGDWIKIARDIEINYENFDAFIVVHGTDTMSYTASALSFLLQDIGKSVIITGSQVPLAEWRTDAVENLLGALTIAGHFVIPEIGLFFNDRLFRGNRTSKMNGVEFNAFDSPNMPPIVEMGVNIKVHWDKVWNPHKISKFKIHKTLNPNVATLRLFPGITKDTVQAFFYPGIEGVVLETFGAGNAPSNRPDILQILEDACKAGVVIVNCSQCKKANVTAIYQTGTALAKIGVIPGGDMTPECALTKLSYLLGKYPKNPSKVRHLISKNLRGEITEIVSNQRFSYLPIGNTSDALLAGLLKVLGHNIAAEPIRSSSSFLDQDEPLHSPIEFADDKKIANSLIPIAFCHAIREGDIPMLKYLLDEYPSFINLCNFEGLTPLHLAVCEGKPDIVKMLLKNGGNVHLRNRFNRSPLFDAVLLGFEQVVHVLRQAGAHFSQLEGDEIAANLCIAVKQSDLKKLELFITAGVDPNTTFQDKRTPLHLAVSNNEVDIVYYLISKSGSPRKKKRNLSPQPDTANSSSAESSEYVEEMKYLVDLEPVDAFGNVPLDIAKKNGFNEIIQMLQSALGP